MSRVKAIPLFLDGDEAKHLYETLEDFFKKDCTDPNRFTFVIGQSAWAEDTYLKILYDGVDDVRIEIL